MWEDTGAPGQVKYRLEVDSCVKDEIYAKPLFSKAGYWENKARQAKMDSEKTFRSLRMKSGAEIATMSGEALKKEYLRLATAAAKSLLAMKATTARFEKYKKMSPKTTRDYLENISKDEIKEAIIRPLALPDTMTVSVIGRDLKVTSYKVSEESRDDNGNLTGIKKVTQCANPGFLKHAAVHNHGVNVGFLDAKLNTLTDQDIYRKEAQREAHRERRREGFQRRENWRRQRQRQELFNERRGGYDRDGYDRNGIPDERDDYNDARSEQAGSVGSRR